MVCKKDVVTWFKELKSYKRADVMCSLLNVCLPFELRFLGTCLEELGKRDFHELRQSETEANSQTELSSPELQSLSNNLARSKLALYMTVLHSYNYSCSSLIYKILTKNEDVSSILKTCCDENVLEELLLIYTLAINHPAFSFEQKHRLEKILHQLQEEEEKLYGQRNKIVYSGPASHENVPEKHPPPLQFPFLQGYSHCIGLEEAPIMGLTGPAQCPPIPPGAPHFPVYIEPNSGGLVSCHCIRDNMGVAYPSTTAPGATVIVNPHGWPTILPSETSPLVSRTSSPCQSNSASRPGSPGKVKFPPPRVPPPDNAREPLSKEVIPPEQMNGVSGEITDNSNVIIQLRTIISKQVPTNGIGPNLIDVSNKKRPDDNQVKRCYPQELVPGVENLSLYNFGPMMCPPIAHHGCNSCILANTTLGPRKSQRPMHGVYRRHPLDQESHLRLVTGGEQAVFLSNSSASDTASDHSPPDTPGPPPPTGMVLGPSNDAPPGVEERLSGVNTNNVEDRRSGQSQGRGRGLGRHRSNPPGIQTLPRGRGPNPSHRRRDVGSNMSNGNGGNNSSSGNNGGGNGGPMDDRKVFAENPAAFYSQTPGGFVPHHYIRPAYRTFSTGGYVRPTYPFQPNGDLVYQYPPPPAPPPTANPQPFMPPPPYPPAAAPPILHPPKLSCYNCGSQSHIHADCPEATIEEVAKQGQYRIDFSSSGFSQKSGSSGGGNNEVQAAVDK